MASLSKFPCVIEKQQRWLVAGMEVCHRDAFCVDAGVNEAEDTASCEPCRSRRIVCACATTSHLPVAAPPPSCTPPLSYKAPPRSELLKPGDRPPGGTSSACSDHLSRCARTPGAPSKRQKRRKQQWRASEAASGAHSVCVSLPNLIRQFCPLRKSSWLVQCDMSANGLCLDLYSIQYR